MANILAVLLAMFFFLGLLLYRRWRKEQIDLANLGNCALAAMALPNLFIFLYCLLTNLESALKMAELPQYLTIGVLTILFLTGESIFRNFTKPPP